MRWRSYLVVLLVIWRRTTNVWAGPKAALVLAASALSGASPSAMAGAAFAMVLGATLFTVEARSRRFLRRFVGPGHLLVHGMMWGSGAMLVRQGAMALRGSDGLWAYAAPHIPTTFTQLAAATANLTATIAASGIMLGIFIFQIGMLVGGTALFFEGKSAHRHVRGVGEGR